MPIGRGLAGRWPVIRYECSGAPDCPVRQRRQFADPILYGRAEEGCQVEEEVVRRSCRLLEALIRWHAAASSPDLLVLNGADDDIVMLSGIVGAADAVPPAGGIGVLALSVTRVA